MPHLPVADPGFPRRGAPTSKMGASTYYLAKFFPDFNCMKMKEFGPRGRARVPDAIPLDPPMSTHLTLCCISYNCVDGLPTGTNVYSSLHKVLHFVLKVEGGFALKLLKYYGLVINTVHYNIAEKSSMYNFPSIRNVKPDQTNEALCFFRNDCINTGEF